MSMCFVQYVGRKDRKEDNVARTGVVWNGPGDVQPFPAEHWPLLAKHPDVWAIVEPGHAGKTLGDADKQNSGGGKADEVNDEFAGKSRDELRALAVERGLEPHHALGEAKLLTLLRNHAAALAANGG